ncbi:GNAT family N-acetyltransferase [Oceanobacillus sp. 1P07AA]|uniref:GNAT family N-acetyltransferase n=1 Tax=Oceanobacillus sp. 1P07AA TaxID=3132293 RepID=UPI0039A4FFD6
MHKPEQVELHLFRDEFEDELKSFTLPDDQERFTALPDKILTVTDGQYRVVILNQGTPVGFFILHCTERVQEYSNNPNAMLLTSLSINHKHQGKGYAKKGMLALERFIVSNFPDCNEIVLAVNHKNLPAQQLYKHVGFTDTGRRKIGAIGEQFIMELRMKE